MKTLVTCLLSYLPFIDDNHAFMSIISIVCIITGGDGCAS